MSADYTSYDIEEIKARYEVAQRAVRLLGKHHPIAHELSEQVNALTRLERLR